MKVRLYHCMQIVFDEKFVRPIRVKLVDFLFLIFHEPLTYSEIHLIRQIRYCETPLCGMKQCTLIALIKGRG